MRKAIYLFGLLLFFTVRAFTDPQVSRVVTLVTGAPVRVSTTHVQAQSLFIQMLHGGSNLGYVLFADPAVACNVNTAGQLVAELAPATATAPGGTFVFPTNTVSQSAAGGTDMAFWCLQGFSSDTAVISFNARN